VDRRRGSVIDPRHPHRGHLNDRQLEQLRNLMDWQLRRMGYDPLEVNLAFRDLAERKQKKGWVNP
jgi:hypothetical protein